MASDLDKPRGFKAIGRAEALDFLGPQPVGLIWGVGAALQRKLEQDGIGTIAELRDRDEVWLMKRYGVMGRRLYRFARGEDLRTVDPDEETKSISAETTFNRDIPDLGELQHRLWPLCETVSRRMKAAGLTGGSVTLKLKTGRFQAGDAQPEAWMPPPRQRTPFSTPSCRCWSGRRPGRPTA